MDKSLLKNLKPIELAGAVIYHNEDHTYAKAFIGDGDKMKANGFSTAERWKPSALELAIRHCIRAGIEVPREKNPYAPPLPPEPEPEKGKDKEDKDKPEKNNEAKHE